MRDTRTSVEKQLGAYLREHPEGECLEFRADAGRWRDAGIERGTIIARCAISRLALPADAPIWNCVQYNECKRRFLLTRVQAALESSAWLGYLLWA
jgi:hypothetical protein